MGWQRAAVAVVALVVVLGAGGASAALKEYRTRTAVIFDANVISPRSSITQVPGPPGMAVIDDTAQGSPVLLRFTEVADGTSTTFGILDGFIFVFTNRTEGPTGGSTGTGGTETSIAWGLLTGWTVTGTYWCNSSPSFTCGMRWLFLADEESVDPWTYSDFYDLGTWTFHGTGFTATPFVFRTFEHKSYRGNYQHVFRGLRVLDGTVPAVPAVGLAVLAGSIVMGSLASLRRRNRSARKEFPFLQPCPAPGSSSPRIPLTRAALRRQAPPSTPNSPTSSLGTATSTSIPKPSRTGSCGGRSAGRSCRSRGLECLCWWDWW